MHAELTMGYGITVGRHSVAMLMRRAGLSGQKAEIPDRGGWKAHGRGNDPTKGTARVGFDYTHAPVDDHTHLAYAEVHPDEKGVTAAGFLTRAAGFFAR